MPTKFFFVLAMILSLVLSVQADITTGQKQKIQQEVKSLISSLDAKSMGATLQDQEFVTTLYQQILHRNPTKDELDTATWLLHGDHCGSLIKGVSMSRSRLLSLLLAKKEKVNTLTYETLNRNLSVLRKLDLTTAPKMEISATQDKEPVAKSNFDLPLQAHTGEYKVFHGYLHAHTSYSDGEGTPEQAYKMVRDVAKYDFFSVTDHAILLNAWPWENQWKEIKEIAAKYNEPGKFVALHGFEWSSPIFGHINVIHSEDITNCVDNPRVKDLCKWVSEHPGVISRFNHPGRDPIGMEFDHFKLRTYAVKQMVGLEMFNKSKGIQRFLSKGYGGEYNFLDEANMKGWKLGAMGGQDNHKPDWGVSNFNVGVWATELTRKAIIEAYRERRTFATEDRNSSLSFKMDGAQMGSRLMEGEKNLVISLADGDRENFVKIDVYKTGKLLKSHAVKSSNPTITMKVQTVVKDYYYVVATQEDGDLSLSSPIWIEAAKK